MSISPVIVISKKISEDGTYVELTLSTGERVNIETAWATQYVQELVRQDVIGDVTRKIPRLNQDGSPELDESGSQISDQVTTKEVIEQIDVWQNTKKTLLEQEIEQAPIRAQERIDRLAANTAAAEVIINGL